MLLPTATLRATAVGGQTACGCAARPGRGWKIKAASAGHVSAFVGLLPSMHESLAVQTSFASLRPAFLIGHGLAPAAFLASRSQGGLASLFSPNQADHITQQRSACPE